MSLSHLNRMARYTVWANHKVADYIATMDDHLYNAHAGLVFRSVRGTVNHLILSSIVCISTMLTPSRLSRIEQEYGKKHEEAVKWYRMPNKYASKTSETCSWEEYMADKHEAGKALVHSSAQIRDYLAQHPFAEGTRLSYKTTSDKPVEDNLTDVYLHIFNHYTHHRGQITAGVTALGCKVLDDLDYIFYVRAHDKATLGNTTIALFHNGRSHLLHGHTQRMHIRATAKEYDGKKYTGMAVGMNYDQGVWKETKVDPDRWEVHFDTVKRRKHNAPEGSGAAVGSGYHWYIIAHQTVEKLNANDYSTSLNGVKYKLCHKWAGSENWSISGPKAQKEREIALLEDALERAKQELEAMDPDPAMPPKKKVKKLEKGQKTLDDMLGGGKKAKEEREKEEEAKKKRKLDMHSDEAYSEGSLEDDESHREKALLEADISFILLRYLRCPVWRGQDRLGQETVAESNFAEWHARLAQPPIHLWAARYWCSPFFYARILLGLFAGWAMVGAAMIASAPNVDECINCNDVVFSTAFYVIVFHCSLVGMYALMWTIIPCITLPWVLLLPEELDFGKRCASRDMVHGMPLITGSDLRRSSQQEQPGEAQHPDECSICIGEYEETERIRVLPCRHHFHADCVDQWLYVDKSCPLCKHDIDKTWPREVEMTQHGQLNTQSVSEP
ncbi:hypothetical protein BZG36_05248 [Bifiguratus adelaidae]|uniref:RING-type domain-containing protein n=1 Tax=Bifiguratus adelaidae TaxID=1938954 RepID=A0A261XUD0_9FUNG|nr:hypothetical protein BZG36_05248 [Bifiguratus adelaidae]